MTRKEALDKLLDPIVWDWSSSIDSRKGLVISRRDAVRAVHPFLTELELVRTKEWLVNERHIELWD